MYFFDSIMIVSKLVVWLAKRVSMILELNSMNLWEIKRKQMKTCEIQVKSDPVGEIKIW